MRSSRRLARLAVLACATGYVVVPPPPRRATLRRATRSSDKLEEPTAAGRDPLVARLAETAGAEIARAAAAADAATGPLGDYAPASGAIQGILKGMYDAFTSDLASKNADQAMKQKQ